jgi:hypothetical protein
MQVIILEYVVPRVLEYPCVKFNRVSMSKTLLIDILPSGSVLIGHIRPVAKLVQTRLDKSGPRARHIRPPRTAHPVEYQFLIGSS